MRDREYCFVLDLSLKCALIKWKAKREVMKNDMFWWIRIDNKKREQYLWWNEKISLYVYTHLRLFMKTFHMHSFLSVSSTSRNLFLALK